MMTVLKNGFLLKFQKTLRVQKRYLGIYTTLGLAAVVLNVPFYYMLITAFKSNAELAQLHMSFGIQEPTLEPMRKLLTGSFYLKSALNSVIVAALGTIGNIFFCTMAGYAFAKLTFPGRDSIFLFLLSF